MAGTENLYQKIVFFVGILWFCGKIYQAEGSTPPSNCTEIPENFTGVCCLCSNLDGCDDNVTCPDGFQLYSLTKDICSQETSTVATTTTEFTSQYSSTETVTYWQTSDNTSSVNVGNLCYKCENNKYFDGIKCAPCHSLCLQCNGPSLKNCTHCYFSFNGNCVSECPNNSVNSSVENSPEILCKVHSVDTEDESKFPVAIVAGAVGGVVGLILVVIVVIFVLRRRKPKGQGRSRMSTIIKERNEEGKQENRSTANKPNTKRGNYENQPDPGANFSQDIQQHGDNILRYTKDPTREKKNSDATKRDDSVLYENVVTIRAQKAFKDKPVSHEQLQERVEQEAREQEEIEQLPQAPAPPTAKKRTSFAKRLSKNLIKKSKKSTPKEKVYLDMSGGSKFKPEAQEPRWKIVEKDNTGQEDYEDVDPNMEAKEAEAEMEVYENMSTLKREKRTDKVDAENADMQESYENMEFGTQKIQDTARKVSKDKSVAKIDRDINVKDEKTEVDIADDALEDYENSAVVKEMRKDSSKTVEDSTLYENLKV